MTLEIGGARGVSARPALTWLASYPRSGNTLLRLVLNRCFGLSNQSIYNDREFDDPALQTLIGHEAVGDDAQGFVRAAQSSGKSLFVKTHELPGEDGHPAITMVRDGRAALVSRWHYARDLLGQDVSLADMITGQGSQSWSNHVTAWALSRRPDTLVLRYEELAAGAPAVLDAIARFVGVAQRQAFDVSFDALHAMNPAFFRKGSNAANIAEMDGDAPRLFGRLHGAAQAALGYPV